MGKLKEKDIYDVIYESKAIQKLIREIVNNSTDTPMQKGLSNAEETEKLHSQIAQLHTQLRQANAELEQYKNSYVQVTQKLKEYDRLKNEVDALKSREEELKLDLQKKTSTIRKFENSIETINNRNSQLLSELETAKETINHLKKQFEEPINYMNMYKSLSDCTRNGLENVISDKNELTFISSCSDENNLDAIWEYAKDISNDNTYVNDFKSLIGIFNYFFDLFNDSLPEPKYIRDDVKLGDYLDDDYYDRCSGSATSGEITEIILRGYRSINTGRIIHKSLVRA